MHALQTIIRQSFKTIMIYETTTNPDCLQGSVGIPGISPRKEYSLRPAFFHQRLPEIVQPEGTLHFIAVIHIGWANSLSEQAVSLIDSLLIQAMPVMLEKLVCFCYPTIAVFQEYLGCHGPPVHGWRADCSLLERGWKLSCSRFSDTIRFK